jgi:hypothetical protein
MAEIDQRGLFYLGRRHDLAAGQTSGEPTLYDSADLTTHAVCVGMTGSGKTGLCLALLEEAALDGIPAIAIDPKGDLGNLLLTFPDLRPADFRPWIDESQAVREGVTPDEFAAKTAELWKNGLVQWGEDGERIRRLKDAVDCAIYTPGSSAGLPLTVLKSFTAPPAIVLDDADAFGDRVQAAASSLLALLDVDFDPVNSREHILLSKVLADAWRAGRDLDLPAIIAEVQRPSFSMVGAVPVDTFLAPRDRDALAMRMNNLLASPAFASWLAGEPLDVQRLLYTAEGKPRLSILSIAHLDDAERMFFVTLLLNEAIAWMRGQRGTSSLRAILYMDEIFGYFPPTANPPSKRPMLTLLKQARAYGVGCVLATQNPVDLDYKGLSNAGTWFLGRLQTERDKLRVIDGLEGASAEAGRAFDRAGLEHMLSALGKRVFLMNNVHDAAPTVFQSRWALSYLAGPLTRAQISTLMADRKQRAAGSTLGTTASTSAPDAASVATAPRQSPPVRPSTRPLLSADVVQRFWPVEQAKDAQAGTNVAITYRPALLGLGRVHYVQTAEKLDLWQDVAVLKAIDGELGHAPWSDALTVAPAPRLGDAPQGNASFDAIPGALAEKKTYGSLMRELGDWLYQTQRYVRLACPEIGVVADAGENETAFRARVAPRVQAQRKEKAIAARAAEIARLEQEVEAVQAERSQHRWWFVTLLMNTVARTAEILLTGLFGRRSRKQIVTATLWNQAMKSRRLAGEAKRKVREKTAALEQLKAAEDVEVNRLDVPFAPAAVPIDRTEIAPRKSDVDVDQVLLAWLPWRTSHDGSETPAYAIED